MACEDSQMSQSRCYNSSVNIQFRSLKVSVVFIRSFPSPCCYFTAKSTFHTLIGSAVRKVKQSKSERGRGRESFEALELSQCSTFPTQHSNLALNDCNTRTLNRFRFKSKKIGIDEWNKPCLCNGWNCCCTARDNGVSWWICRRPKSNLWTASSPSTSRSSLDGTSCYHSSSYHVRSSSYHHCSRASSTKTYICQCQAVSSDIET